MAVPVNYNSEAELFPPTSRNFSKGRVGYKRFKSAARQYDLQLRSSHRSCFLAPTLKSKRTDSMALPSGSSTRAKLIH